MAVGDIVPVPGAQFEQTLASASPDVLREMIREFAQRMMDADVEVACNAGYGEVTADRVNSLVTGTGGGSGTPGPGRSLLLFRRSHLLSAMPDNRAGDFRIDCALAWADVPGLT